MSDIRAPQQPSNIAPTASGPSSQSGWSALRAWHVRLIGLSVLVVIVLIAAAINFLGHKGSPGDSSSPQGGSAATTSSKADEFTFDGVTYGVEFTEVALNGQTTQSATGLDVKYLFSVKSEPANLDRTPDSFIFNAAVPKAETQQCGSVPTPDPTNPYAGVGTYFMPVAQKSGWCQMLDGLNNANNEGEQADDPSAPNYSPTPQEISLTGLTAPVDRSKALLVVSPVNQPNQQWIIPYQGGSQ